MEKSEIDEIMMSGLKDLLEEIEVCQQHLKRIDAYLIDTQVKLIDIRRANEKLRDQIKYSGE